jgi:hypothetical protein
VKAQDKFKYDETIVGLNGIYHTIEGDSFFVNSNCVIASGKKITRGKEYILFSRRTEKGFNMVDVILVDCYYREGIINLIVQHIRSKRVFTIDHCLECHKIDCTWILIDLNYFIDKMDAKAIQDYCEDCNKNEKKSVVGINPKSSNNDLLEFEF